MLSGGHNNKDNRTRAAFRTATPRHHRPYHAGGVDARLPAARIRSRLGCRQGARPLQQRGTAPVVDGRAWLSRPAVAALPDLARPCADRRSEEHTSELQSLMRISYAVFCLKKKKKHNERITNVQ